MSDKSKSNGTELAQPKRTLRYVPRGQATEIELTYDFVTSFLVRPTRSGKKPTHGDVVKFMLLCEARQLNPAVGEAFCVGYDGKDGPEFNLITSIVVLQKRAESHPQFAGIEFGIVVDKGGDIIQKPGTCLYPGEKLIGGWSKVYRRDRDMPFFSELALGSFDKKNAFWSRDPGGMICKCAKASSYREAFPNDTADLFTEDESNARVTIIDAVPGEPEPPKRKPRRRQPVVSAADAMLTESATPKGELEVDTSDSQVADAPHESDQDFPEEETHLQKTFVETHGDAQEL